MKITLLILVFTLSVVASGQSLAMEGNSKELVDKGLKRHSIEKGTITYKIENQPNDTLIVVFDRFGWREMTMEFGEKKYYGIKTSIDSKILIDGQLHLTMNLLDNTGIYKTVSDQVKMASYKNPEELFIARMSQLKATKIGTELVLDNECEIWQYTSRGKLCKIWAWKGIDLKHQSATQTKTVINLDFTSEIADEAFKIPETIQWKNSN